MTQPSEGLHVSSQLEVEGLSTLRPGIRALQVTMPGGHIPYSLCYLIEDARGSLHLIDPGWLSAENWESLGRACAASGHRVDDIASVVVTHLHPDHIGMADRVRTATGAAVVLHEREQVALDEMAGRAPAESPEHRFDEWGVPAARLAELDVTAGRPPMDVPNPADVLVTDGALLDIPGRTIRVVLTPGHTPGHICLVDAEDGLVFTGDHVLPTIHPGVGLGGETATNPIADYLESLDRIALFDEHEVCPGHEYVFRGLAARCVTTAEHHLRRSREVAEHLRIDGDPTVWQVASELTWTAGWANLKGFYLLSALAQTAMHLEFVRSEASAPYLA
jgi:glyoxylase-like metal-dependent hydrolase (beta-lactamase superfamily II)